MEEAAWRLGIWSNKTWCTPNTSHFNPLLRRMPKNSALVLPHDKIVYSAHLTRQPSWTSDPEQAEWMDERIRSYRIWRYASQAAVGLDAIAVTTGDQCTPSRKCPLLAHCREAAYRMRNGLVLWPGLRHSTAMLAAEAAQAAAGDVAWGHKLARALWRGGPSGMGPRICEAGTDPLDGPCQMGKVSRSHLVNKFRRMPELFDVGFVGGQVERVPPELRAANKRKLTMAQQLEYKVIISAEGNTCSSVLGWGLSTNSVMAIVYPQLFEAPVQYALEPWVHYIPYRYDLSDLERNIRWCFEHDGECAAIAQRAKAHVGRLTDERSESGVQVAALATLAALNRPCEVSDFDLAVVE
ncbi:unnamed protein product [Phaeothamnion confervicola]